MTEMLAIRTVSETDDVHVIEGRLAYGGPFNGADSWGTMFTARTDWGWDLHPDGLPVLYNHGFDADFGLRPIGRTSPPSAFRTDADGVWVQMELDKRNKYYATRVRPLLDAGGLGLSQGSAEHSVDWDRRSGEIKTWPTHELSLTPTESNPWNVIAARSAETSRHLSGVAIEDEAPIGVRSSGAAYDAATGANILAQMLAVLGDEAGETEQVAMINDAIASWSKWIDAERAEIGTDADDTDEATVAYMSAIRLGKRNSADDMKLIQQAHDSAHAGHAATVALGADCQTPDPVDTSDDEEPGSGEDDTAARAAATGTGLRLVTDPATVTVDPAVRSELLEFAAERARELVRTPVR